MIRELLAVDLCHPCAPIAQSIHVDTATPTEHADDVGFTGGEPGMTAREFAGRRAASLLTMDQAAKLLGVSLKSVWRWENGEAAIDHFKAAAIRAVLVPGMGAKRERMDSLADLEGRR